MTNEGLGVLLEMLKYAEFCKAFANDPTHALQSRNIDVPYNFVNVLAELSYDELRLLGRIGDELKAVLSGGEGLLF